MGGPQCLKSRERTTIQGRTAGPLKTTGRKEEKAMDTSRRLPQPKASKGLLNSAVGPLQRQLRSGEYNLFKFATMFEGDFVQVSKRGGTSDVHNQVQLVRVAIAATSPSLQIPNVLLLARPILLPEDHGPSVQKMFSRAPRKMRFELTRLLPLCFVKISIHNWEKQQLRFKMATGRTFYLQLLPPQEGQSEDFESWVKIIQLLRPPADLNPERKGRGAELLKSGEPVLLSAEVTATESSEDGGSSTIAEILSILQDEPQDDAKPSEPSESHPGGQEKASLALLANKEEEPKANPGLDLLAKKEDEGKSDPGLASKEEVMKSKPGLVPLPSGEDNPKPESPPPSEGPQEDLRRFPEGDRMKPKGHPGSRKKTPRSRSRRSHSVQKVDRSSGRLSSLLSSSFSRTHQNHHKGPNWSREKKR